MSWSAVVAALDSGEALRSRVSVYAHPLAGRPVLWHVLHALSEVTPPPDEIRVVHDAHTPAPLPEAFPVPLRVEAADADGGMVALRRAVTPPGLRVLVDGAAPLIAPATLARLLRAGESAAAALAPAGPGAATIAVAGEGPAVASADDPRRPTSVNLIAATAADELIRVVDRLSLARAGVALRDRLVRQHAAAGVTFLLPETTWLDVDVRIGADTVVYPGAVLEGRTEIGRECVIGPYSRVVESTIGRGVELKGWNYVTRTTIRNHAVLEPYVRRGFD